MVTIGKAKSMNDPDGESITTNDRQTLIQTMGGNVVQDYGYHASDSKLTLSLQFDAANWALVCEYWQKRELVSIADTFGHTITARIIIKSYSYVDRFRDYIKANIEIWRV